MKYKLITYEGRLDFNDLNDAIRAAQFFTKKQQQLNDEYGEDFYSTVATVNTIKEDGSYHSIFLSYANSKGYSERGSVEV